METKKNLKYDLERRRPLFFGIGMILSLSLAITAFEWKTEVEPIVIPEPEVDETWYMRDEPIITKHPELLPPKPKQEEKKVVLEQIGKIVEKEFESRNQPEIEVDIEDIIELSAPKPTIPDDAPFEVVEEMPSFPGGDIELLKFIGKNVKYPRAARNIGVQGRVSVQFIVEKDGSLTDIQILRGIGAGCDEEALRVMNLVPNFSPGKQRGVPVRVKMVVPINFKLN
jgi:periplasmic protein TonB